MGIDPVTLTAIGTLISGGASLLNVLDGGSKGAAPPPPLEPPIAMPDAEAQARARRRSISSQLGRRGRASTILTSPDSAGGDTLGT